MQDFSGSKEELIKQVQTLRSRVAQLESVDARNREIEKALQDGLAQLFAIFKDAPVLLFIVDSQLRVRKANSTTLRFTKRQAEEIIKFRFGEALRCFYSLDDPEGCGFGSSCENCMLRQAVLRTFETSRSYCRIRAQMPLTHQQKQEQLFLLVSTIPIRVSGEKMVLLCLEDITEQKKAQAEISDWVNRLEILNGITIAVSESLELKKVLDTALEKTQALLKADGGVIYLFDETSQTFRSSVHRGISQEVIKEVTGFKMGQGPSGKVAQSGKPLVLPDLATDPRSISPASAKEGWHSYAGVPIKAKGKVSAVLVLVSHKKDYFRIKHVDLLQDIGNHIGIAIEHARLYEDLQQELTQRKKAEEELRESEERFRSIFESANDVIVFVNKTGKIIELNGRVKDILGYDRDEMMGKNVLKFGILSIKSTPLITKLFREAVKKGGLLTVRDGRNVTEVWLNHKDGHSVLVEASTTAVKKDGKLEGFLSILRDITERKRAEEMLRKAQEEQAAILTTMSEHVVYRDTEMRVLWVNRAAGESVGLAPEQLVGRYCYEIWHQRSKPCVICPAREALETDQPREAEITTPDGRVWWIRAYPIRDANGDIVGIANVTLEITERKRAEETLEKAEKEKATILDTMSEFVVYQDTEHRVVWANRAAGESVGSTAEELLGRYCYEIWQARSKPCANCPVEKVWKTSRLETGEVHSPDGRVWSILANPVKDTAGNVIGVVEITLDVTERKKAEEALRESEGKLKDFLASATDGFMLFDAKLNLIEINKAALQILGKNREELIGKSILDISPDVKETGRYNKYIEVIMTGKPLFLDDVVHHPKFRNRHLSLRVFKVGNGFGIIGTDITERKKTEQALRESQERYRAIFEQAADSIVLVDAETSSLVEFNDRTHEALGYTREEFEKLKIADFEVFETINQVAKHIEAVVKKGAGIFETKHKTKDGKIRDIQVSAKAISIGGKNFIQGIWRDITKHKQAEQAIRESEESYKALANSITDVFFAMDKDLRYTYWNKASEKLTGIKAKDAIGKSIFEIFPDNEDARRTAAVYQKILKTQQSTSFVNEYQLGGKNFVFEIDAYPTRDGISVFVKDITKRKKAEEKLKQYQFMVESAHDAIFFKDLQSRYIVANDKALEAFGLSRQQIIGKNDYEVSANGAEAKKNIEDDKMVFETGKPVEVTKQMTDINGKQRWFQAVKVPQFDDKGNIIGLVGIARDVTERKRAEQKLLEDQTQLKSLASQLTLAEERERRRIAAELHDQVSQSLAISKIKLDALRVSAPSIEVVKALDEVCNSLEQTITNMKSLTFDLSFPVLYELGFEAAVGEWLTSQIQEKHGIATEFEDDGQLKPLDDDVRVLLFRDVRELLVNVIKHAHANKVKVSIRKVGSQIYVSVEDDGVGFDPAEVVAAATKKAEFGLFSIRERLEELGGRLEIKSSPGHGCKVTMTAPLKHSNIAKEE